MERRYFTREGQRYVQVSPGARYEQAIQHLVERNLPALFPDYRGVLLDPLFETPLGNVKPDLVMVRNDGEGWALVEVEIEGHSFSDHVLPQLGKLTLARGTARLAEKLAERISALTPETIRRCISFSPQVFLVIHGSSRQHEAHLTRLGVEVRDVDVLEAPDKPNEYILVVHDPTIRRRSLAAQAIRSTSPVTKNIWKIEDQSLGELVGDGGKLEVETLGTRALWSVTLTQDGVLLNQPSGLSDRTSEVDSMVRARVLVDDEHRVVYLEPAGSSL